MATKGKDNLQIKPQQSSREAKQLSKFRLIGKDDNASTTGLLVNPPAAVIPNPTGAGGQAGAQGLFGATLGAGTPEDRGGYRGGRGNQNPPVENPFMTLFNIYTNPDTYSLRGPIQTGNSRRDKGGNVNPSLVPLSNGFAGMGTGAGTQVSSPVFPFPSGAFAPSGFVPIDLSGQPQPQAQPRTVINQPGFVPQNVMPPVSIPQQNNAFQTPPTNGFTALPQPTSNIRRPDGQATATPSLYSASSYMAPQWQQQAQAQQAQAITKPAGVYDPNGANGQQWRDYWNQMSMLASQNPSAYMSQVQAQAQAEGRPDPFAPVVMSREQIWQMKAEQRRRQLAKGDVGGGSSLPAVQGAQVSPVPYTGFTGDYYSTILNTGTG